MKLTTLVLVSALAAIAPQEVYRSRTDVVAIDVAVADGRKPVLTLTKADFEVRDNGVVQTVLDFDREKLPLDLTITADLSGSMTPPKLESIERAVAQVGKSMHELDRSAVLTFTTVVTERRAMAPPPVTLDLSKSINGGTSIVDALMLAMISAPQHDRRQLGLFMTDGEDTSSVFDVGTALETARFANTQISFVIVRDGGHLENGTMVSMFRSISRMTGGDVVEVQKGDDLSRAFLDAVENFRTSYVLRYSPTGVASRGWHDVEVRAKNSKYTVRSRRGYWADR